MGEAPARAERGEERARGAGGCEANARRAERCGRRRQRRRAPHGPRHSRGTLFARGRAVDRKSATERVRLISCSPARHRTRCTCELATTAARCRVRRNRRLGGTTERSSFKDEERAAERASSRGTERGADVAARKVTFLFRARVATAVTRGATREGGRVGGANDLAMHQRGATLARDTPAPRDERELQAA